MITKNGTATAAPTYFCNTTGSPSWSGKAADDLSATDLLDILNFCKVEGWRQGWNDEFSGRASEASKQPYFHPGFLRGMPHALWSGAYEAGRTDWRLSAAGVAAADAGSGI